MLSVHKHEQVRLFNKSTLKNPPTIRTTATAAVLHWYITEVTIRKQRQTTKNEVMTNVSNAIHYEFESNAILVSYVELVGGP